MRLRQIELFKLIAVEEQPLESVGPAPALVPRKIKLNDRDIPWVQPVGLGTSNRGTPQELKKEVLSQTQQLVRGSKGRTEISGRERCERSK